ncbi:hypothetical protein ADICYQ_1707 [Cyclobacterium qasimii M12-11B]|uniref:Uncharacterized protein n=1 Tax=Cyclobacterium qasimii M12-11B TaxID=641524 RepID=S7VI83_9BACT|nr:hypothetical protein ADICYQ_1707 [Cyclobacterium qasimii M12-11B]
MKELSSHYWDHFIKGFTIFYLIVIGKATPATNFLILQALKNK